MQEGELSRRTQLITQNAQGWNYEQKKESYNENIEYSCYMIEKREM